MTHSKAVIQITPDFIGAKNMTLPTIEELNESDGFLSLLPVEFCPAGYEAELRQRHAQLREALQRIAELESTCASATHSLARQLIDFESERQMIRKYIAELESTCKAKDEQCQRLLLRMISLEQKT